MTLNEKRTCNGSTQKSMESWPGALAEQVKIQQYVGIKFGKDVANKIKYSKMEMAVIQSEGTAFGLKEEMES